MHSICTPWLTFACSPLHPSPVAGVPATRHPVNPVPCAEVPAKLLISIALESAVARLREGVRTSTFSYFCVLPPSSALPDCAPPPARRP